MLASKISDLTSSYIFWYSGHPKTPKNVFFRISHNYWPFWCRRPNMGSTIRKLTSRGFQKCGTYRVFEFLNGSYGCSKSTESEIFDSSPKIGDVTKKRHGFNKPFWDLIWIGHQTDHVRTLFYSYEVCERNIEAVSWSRALRHMQPWMGHTIGKFGRLSTLIEFFACFHIICDRYTSDYAHFTFSDTIWPLSLS